MAYGLRYQLEVVWVPDGANAMTVPSAQKKRFQQTSLIQVPGGDTLTAANLNLAIGTSSPVAGSMAADLEAQCLASLAQLQSFNTGQG